MTRSVVEKPVTTPRLTLPPWGPVTVGKSGPLGKLVLRVTIPEKPFEGARLTSVKFEFPALRVREGGLEDIEKFGGAVWLP